MDFIIRRLREYGALSVAVIALLSKPSRREVRIKPDRFWYGKKIPDKFVVGCGLDYENKYRGKKGIFEVIFD